jgi:hypothetical protein
MAVARLEGLGELKNPMSASGIEPAACRLVAYCLNQLRYSVPPEKYNTHSIFNIYCPNFYGFRGNYTERILTLCACNDREKGPELLCRAYISKTILCCVALQKPCNSPISRQRIPTQFQMIRSA